MLLNAFVNSRSGNFAVISALAMVPLVGSMGLAVDYSRGLGAKAKIQDRADEAALAVAREGPILPDMKMYEAIKAHLAVEAPLKDLQVSGSWTAANEYTVTIVGNLPLGLTSVLPGVGKIMPVEVSATARYGEVETEYKPPTLALLDPEAGDYNRIYAYCYDALKKNSDGKGRNKEVAIADNGGETYKEKFPKCEDGETLSYRLYNVRDSRTNKKNWDSPSASKFNYYTDVTQEYGKADVYSPASNIMLETVLCPSEALCKPKPIGIIPVGKYRNPQKATEPCAPGKFMYYGWEDRPPASGDRDYDDIRLIIECPVVTVTGSRTVRLVR